MIILGIDPGTATTGYGVIKSLSREGCHQKGKKNQNPLKCLGFGCIKTDSKLATGERLKRIHNELNKLIREYKPDIIYVENVYFFKNLKTAMPVSQAKGVILFTAAKKKIPTYEVAPLEVKMSIVGYGRAEKKQIQKMVENLLKLNTPLKSDDAADALGIAICGAFKESFKRRLDKQKFTKL
ncbi:MAG: crossover junction endodeoxyribonuclease RuvC [Candidatus Staskawiczbacteria bacterium CG10_big_fil_rev_8_21_14_0_10_38_10]|uniref:Crossover junction endodeoxyribonuclease RuvC n=1 Tax=Candidatus Staskawiczbacteria bacterium CG10_big_fil_rev_8_21_14_0_10_38_10 TaxID=1974891 RepID=A0A2H9T165_9BACT|nr:MAG: crossover junction endodeoxyribonuclease RuvC [Candidatus Staskawiczbacteria bacterium CG10_big_fil_rev_8_21_14_0_10_38_10]